MFITLGIKNDGWPLTKLAVIRMLLNKVPLRVHMALGIELYFNPDTDRDQIGIVFLKESWGVRKVKGSEPLPYIDVVPRGWISCANIAHVSI